MPEALVTTRVFEGSHREEAVVLGVDAGSVGRSVVVASADAGLRRQLLGRLTGMRWQVREAAGGADAIVQMEERLPDVLVLDHWLPDLEVGEFAGQVQAMYPSVDVLRVDGEPIAGAEVRTWRNELQHALRGSGDLNVRSGGGDAERASFRVRPEAVRLGSSHGGVGAARPGTGGMMAARLAVAIDEMVGDSEVMMELSRLIRMVAPKSATVLIEGETGTGKEVVAKALHRLSPRAGQSFTVLNCAAIPEALLEAELFGHTRGAFTGAVQSRTGRIEAAHGGTLFLDEIGEMPLALQAKMLRFLESGEIQRVGENDTMRVDVRVIAATHQPLEERATEGAFRLDLYHRLAVFPIEVPPLRRRKEDIPALSEHFLAYLGKNSPRKRLSEGAQERLREHHWPGNVRELAHVLERATILAGDAAEIGAEHVRLRRATRS
jgi:DNA-binding NtrC family response regulator